MNGGRVEGSVASTSFSSSFYLFHFRGVCVCVCVCGWGWVGMQVVYYRQVSHDEWSGVGTLSTLEEKDTEQSF